MNVTPAQYLKAPLTFQSAMWLGLGFLALAYIGAWFIYIHLDNKLDTYKTATESKIDSSRAEFDGKIDSLTAQTSAYIAATQLESKSDNAAIKTQLQAITHSLSEVDGKLSLKKPL